MTSVNLKCTSCCYSQGMQLAHKPGLPLPQKLLLNDNKLKLLPPAICQLRRLSTLWLSNNGLRELPPGLTSLRHLRHL